MASAHPQHHPKFIWRFYSCQKRCYYTVSAYSEREARDQLPDAPCMFSARFSTAAKQSLSYWLVQGGVI
jgi:hypothetical protein